MVQGVEIQAPAVLCDECGEIVKQHADILAGRAHIDRPCRFYYRLPADVTSAAKGQAGTLCNTCDALVRARD